MVRERLSSLWTRADCGATWIGLLSTLGALLGWIPRIPKIGKWSDSPLDALLIIKDGVVESNLLLPLMLLMLGLALMTALGVGCMRIEKVGKYLLGFCGVFVIACASYWIANQTNVKYWGLSYAMWALLVGL